MLSVVDDTWNELGLFDYYVRAVDRLAVELNIPGLNTPGYAGNRTTPGQFVSSTNLTATFWSRTVAPDPDLRMIELQRISSLNQTRILDGCRDAYSSLQSSDYAFLVGNETKIDAFRAEHLPNYAFRISRANYNQSVFYFDLLVALPRPPYLTVSGLASKYANPPISYPFLR